MADISSNLIFSKNSLDIIAVKQATLFTHINWSDDDLQIVRKEIRDFYRYAQKGICSYCRQPVSLIAVYNCHVEHIVPKSLHPDFIFTSKNLCVICADCNQIKRDQETLGEIPETLNNAANRKRYPTSNNAFKIVHPHFDNYDDHILIINGCYIDKGSKKGNFTIGACNLNRKLAVFGWEPAVIDDEKITQDMNSYIDEKDPTKRMKYLGSIKKQLFE
jgi:5-methylcytosine-specific restriction endonuclease McrA